MENPKPTTHAELEALRLKKSNTFFKVKDNFQTVTKDVDTTKRIVTGVANTFNYFDHDGDVLMPGCADKTMAERGPGSNGAAKIKNVKDHVISDRIGVPQVLEQRVIDGKTVQYFESKMMNTTLGNDQLIEYSEGAIDQHSIGFRYIDIGIVTADDSNWKDSLAEVINQKDAEDAGYMFIIKEIAQFEWSPVSFGSNSLTPYLGVKSGNKQSMILKLNNRIDVLQQQLKSGRQSDDAMFDYDMECRQLKQLIDEIFNMPPSPKDTIFGRLAAEAAEKNQSMRICPSCMKQVLSGTGPANCPSCGKFMPTPSNATPAFDLSKAIAETIFIK